MKIAFKPFGRIQSIANKWFGTETSWKILLLIGLRPCTGVILILFFSDLYGSLYWGIISTYFMALGTALTNSVLVFKALTIKPHLPSFHSEPRDTCIVLFSLAMIFSGLVLFKFADVSGLQNFIR